MNKVIGAHSQVTLHFALQLVSGEVVDSNFDRSAVSFTVGDGNLLPAFEAKLMGLMPDAEHVFEIPACDAFGEPNADNIHKMQRHQFNETMALSQGMMVKFADGAKNDQAQLTGVVSEMDGDYVTVDFNHPLAGHTIIFHIKIIDVSNAMIPVAAL